METLYTPAEIARLWKVTPTTIRTIFRDEAGVLKHGREERRAGKRPKVMLRIPQSVLDRVYRKKTA
jgi:hypothetical protein